MTTDPTGSVASPPAGVPTDSAGAGHRLRSAEHREEHRRGWREPWIRLALLIFAGQIAIFWRITPNPVPVPRVTPPPAQRFAAEPGTGPEMEAGLDPWRWLFTPGLWVRPSAEDFSGPAWLRGTAVRIEVEAFDVPERPLPWTGERPGVLMSMPGVRSSLGPAMLWSIPDDSVTVPQVGAPTLPRTPRVRLLGGLSGARVLDGSEPGFPGPALAARPVVVRVRVDSRGELLGPPVVWESSELPAADEAAVRWVRGMRFDLGSETVAGRTGLVEIEWPPGPPPAAETRKGGGA